MLGPLFLEECQALTVSSAVVPASGLRPQLLEEEKRYVQVQTFLKTGQDADRVQRKAHYNMLRKKVFYILVATRRTTKQNKQNAKIGRVVHTAMHSQDDNDDDDHDDDETRRATPIGGSSVIPQKSQNARGHPRALAVTEKASALHQTCLVFIL